MEKHPVQDSSKKAAKIIFIILVTSIITTVFVENNFRCLRGSLTCQMCLSQ